MYTKRFNNTLIQQHWIGKRGVLKGEDGQYYLMCACGRHVSRRQTEFSLNHYDIVMCMDCQKLYTKEHKLYNNPEHKPSTDKTRTCQCCWDKITQGMATASLEVTGQKDGSLAKRMCRRCLGKKYSTMLQKTNSKDQLVCNLI